jgi:putative ABC transport system permease protein
MAAARASESGILRLYRGFLTLYPAEFREEYGRELCLVFVDRWREQRSPAGLLMVWLEALAGIFHEAPKEHANMILQDLRYAIRIMRKDAAVTVAAIAILALGIGSTTLVFSLANGLLLRPLPYAQPDRIVAVDEYSPKDPNENGSVSFPNAMDLAARTQLLESLGVYGGGSAILRGDGTAEQVLAASLTSPVFRALGVAPLLGRTFTAAEDAANGPKVVILGEELWQRRFGRDPRILGRSIELGNSRRTVVGIMPASFRFPARAELWAPLQMDPAKVPRTDYGLQALAKLKPGVSAETATAEAQSLLDQIHRENPAADNGWHARVTPMHDFVSVDYRKAVITLLVAVALLLLIACANVSNLLLVKASARAREMAVRMAMGATRRRLIRQLISESVILGLAGGVLGVALAYAGLPALLSLIPVDLPKWMDFSVDAHVLFFALAVSLVTSLGFGIAPAFGSSGGDLTVALKEGSRGTGSGLRQKLLRNGLVVGEVALSVILLAGAGLTVRSFLAMMHQSLGYRPEHVLSLEISYPQKRYPDGPQAREMLRRLTSEISAALGIASTAFSSGVPLNDGWSRTFTVEGRPRELKDMPWVNHVVITPGYFRTLQIPLLQGRDFAEGDFEQPHVLIVTKAFARQHWPGDGAIGKRIRFGPPKNNEPWHTIVGVVADNKHEALKGVNRAAVYLPYSADNTPNSLLARTAGDPLKIAKAIETRIASVDPDFAISHVYTLPQLIERVTWQDRFLTVLFVAFAAMALALAAVGLYAVLSYTVSLHTHEIGIRMALGASAGSVRRMLMRQGVGLAGVGLCTGLIAALALTQLLKTQLFEISPMDPVTYIATPVALMAVAALAAFLPARRATRVDPVIALRCE